MLKKKTVDDMIDRLHFLLDVANTVEQCAIVLQATERFQGMDFLTTDQANRLKHDVYQKVIDIMEGNTNA